MTPGTEVEQGGGPRTPTCEQGGDARTAPPPVSGATAGPPSAGDDPDLTVRARRASRARALIAVLMAVLAWACAPYLAGLLGAVVLYVICAPAYRRLASRLGARASALVLTVGAAMLLIVPGAWLLTAALQQAPGALRHVAASRVFARASELQVGPVDVGAQLARAGENVIAWASGQAWDVAGGVTHALLNLFLALVGLYYLLPAAGAIWANVRPLVPFSAAGAEALRARFASVTEATLLGILATALSQALIVGLGFWAVGLPNPLVWAVVTGVVSVLPILGSALVWAPGVVVLAADARYGAATALALIGLIAASNVDNVVRPLVYRRVSGIHPMATLIGVIAGVELLGLPGILLGPLAISYCSELVRLYRAEYGV